MVGYGPEDLHFVIELTYNYGVKEYTRGNDYRSITIHSTTAARAVVGQSEFTHCVNVDGTITATAPGGYDFLIVCIVPY